MFFVSFYGAVLLVNAFAGRHDFYQQHPSSGLVALASLGLVPGLWLLTASWLRRSRADGTKSARRWHDRPGVGIVGLCALAVLGCFVFVRPSSQELARLTAAGRLDLVSFFQVANQRVGPCKEVARNIVEGFNQLGKNAAYLRFRTEGAHKTANLMAFELRAGEPRSTVQVSNNSTHYAVQAGGRIYDAFTGPAGLEIADYLTRLISPGTITYETVSHLP